MLQPDEKTVDLHADAFKHLFEPGVLPVETVTPTAMTVERVAPSEGESRLEAGKALAQTPLGVVAQLLERQFQQRL